MKKMFCEHQHGDCTEENQKNRRRLNGPPAMPAHLLPDPHVGDAKNFTFPCYPLDNVDEWTMIAANDDDSIELVLPFDFKLYGTNYPAGTSIWLNNNGNLSFDNAISSFTASEFPINSPMIAPFWSDVDTRGIGKVYYRFFPDNKLSVIWEKVGFYPERGHRQNTFQVVISDGEDPEVGIGTNVCFCYGDMDWTTGGASGGMMGFGSNGATVGVNRGSHNDYIQVGQFNYTGSHYDGPGGEKDGVDYLDFKGTNILVDNTPRKGICFEATGLNIPPISNGFPLDNLVTVPCGSELDYTVQITSPELNQDVTVAISGVPTGMTINQVTSPAGDSISINMKWTPDFATQHGVSEVTFFAEDDYEIPANLTEVLKIHVAKCGSDAEVPTGCQALEESSCNADVGPFCTPWRSPEHCYADESFPLLITNRRVQAFENPEMVEFEGFWFHFLEDKAAQHTFTVDSGYPAPEMYCCVSEKSDLENICFAAGNSIPSAFTIRVTGGHSGKGIYVLPYGFGGVELMSGSPMTLADIMGELGPSVDKILVEEFIDGSEFGGIPSLPTEYKFHMFNGTVGAIDVIHNRGTACSCYAVVDEEWNRLDKHGCFVPQPAFGLDADADGCYDIDYDHGERHPYPFKGQNLCGELNEPKTCLLDSLKAIATDLSKTLGVYMRIDMFVSGDDKVFVQEYTTNHAGGLRHCAAKESDSGCIDSCFLGKIWKDKSSGTIYGGPQTSIPSILDGWRTKTKTDQCSISTGVTAGEAFTQACNA